MIGTGRFLVSIRQFADRYDRGQNDRRTGTINLAAGRLAD
jgi:hypothetical protein